MTDLQRFRSAGVIRQASGAAAAALKMRAAAWDVPLIETSDRLSLLVWDCELRLTPLPDSLRIDLSGPEHRLVGNLRESAAELFAEVGLSVEWDHVDVGALAPGLSLMRVAGVSRPSPNFLRVRLTGPDAGRFGQGGLHFRLLLPPAGRAPVWPTVTQSGRTAWPEGPDALHRPVYTVADQQDDWLEFDIFRHPGSPTCDWAEGNPCGQEVGVIGPGGGWCPEADRLCLFGDETALPAIARMLKLSRGQVRAVVRCPKADLGALGADPRVTRCDDLLFALRQHDPVTDDSFLWFAGSTDQARLARQHLLQSGRAKKSFTVAAYWG